MAAGRVRLLGIASCLPVAAAMLATPSNAAPVSVPGILRGATPSALTAAFEKCMQVPVVRTAPGNTAPQPQVPGAAGPAVAVPPAATPAVPSVANCLANLGFGGRRALVEQTTLCLSQQGLADVASDSHEGLLSINSLQG